MRSKWKGSFLDCKIFEDLKVKNKNIKVVSRNSTVLDYMVGSTYSVYNGRAYVPLSIKVGMVGYKFGHFVFTKRTGIRIHTNKKKK